MKDKHGNKIEIGDTVRVLVSQNACLEKDSICEIIGINDFTIFVKSEFDQINLLPDSVEKVDESIIYRFAGQFPDGSYYVYRGETADHRTWHLNHATLTDHENSFSDFKDIKVIRVMVNLKIIS